MKYEPDNLGFDIEKSLDNESFIKIGHIAGHGITSSEQNYSFADNQTNPGRYYYRLKKISYGGFNEYSNPIEVTVNTPDNWVIYE